MKEGLNMKIKITCSFLILVLIFGGVFVVFRKTSESVHYGIAVSRPETAIAIARVLLSEHFPSSQHHQHENLDFIAEENDGIWIVRNVIPPPVIIDDYNILVTWGVEYYVHIRKSNGEILKIECWG
jgi:hypothetical protein